MKRIFKINGKYFEVLNNDVVDFLKDFPNAIEVKRYVVNGQKYYIELSRTVEFERDMGIDAQPNNTTTPTPNIDQDSDLTLLRRYKSCPDTFPIARGCRSQKVKDVQIWMQFPVKYQTGNFGPITEKGLRDLEVHPSDVITLETYNTLKSEHETANKMFHTSEPQLHPNTPATSNPAQARSNSSLYDLDASNNYKIKTSNKIYKVDDVFHEIKPEQEGDFLKDFPDAVEVNMYMIGGKKYFVELPRSAEFERDFDIK